MASSSRRELLRGAVVGLTAGALLDACSGPAQRRSSGGQSEESAGAQGCVSPYHKAPVTFFVHRLGTDHAEGCSIMDMNGDGLPDITSGVYWYENPGASGGEWKMHKFRQIAPNIHGVSTGNKAFWTEFVADNGEFAIDVNHDGAPDLVTSSWQNDGIWWFENPKKQGVMWKPHFICHSKDTEGMVHADINGDGTPDLIAAHYGRQGLIWINFAGAQPVVHHVGGREYDGHGVGVGDLNGDGKPDILTPFGWLEGIDADHDKWEWHPEWTLQEAGFPILVYDVNNDGKMDVIYGHGHDYGLYWLEQTTQNGKRTWVRHLIDDSFSQCHALNLADIDGDGEPELICGKRYRGHNGHDPGGYDPLCIYYYKIHRDKADFTRYTISYNGTAGAGTQFLVHDMDGDGDLDIVVAGKTGVHWLENLRVNNRSREAREKELLLNYKWPFPGEDDP
jgi:hypothetical protein